MGTRLALAPQHVHAKHGSRAEQEAAVRLDPKASRIKKNGLPGPAGRSGWGLFFGMCDLLISLCKIKWFIRRALLIVAGLAEAFVRLNDQAGLEGQLVLQVAVFSVLFLVHNLGAGVVFPGGMAGFALHAGKHTGLAGCMACNAGGV